MTRRWPIAIVAALGVFVALVAGSALRPQFAAAAPPEPAARSAGVPVAGTHAAEGELRTSEPAAPADKKPFHTTWMTKERPPTPGRLSPSSGGSPQPVSFTALGFQPRGAQPRAPAALEADPDILTRFCVARR